MNELDMFTKNTAPMTFNISSAKYVGEDGIYLKSPSPMRHEHGRVIDGTQVTSLTIYNI